MWSCLNLPWVGHGTTTSEKLNAAKEQRHREQHVSSKSRAMRDVWQEESWSNGRAVPDFCRMESWWGGLLFTEGWWPRHSLQQGLQGGAEKMEGIQLQWEPATQGKGVDNGAQDQWGLPEIIRKKFSFAQVWSYLNHPQAHLWNTICRIQTGTLLQE